MKGIIYPPPDIRAIVDKTARFVAKNGKSFEERIQASEEGKSAKFNFMRPHDPYYAYYEFKIRDFEENGDAPKAVRERERRRVFVAVLVFLDTAVFEDNGRAPRTWFRLAPKAARTRVMDHNHQRIATWMVLCIWLKDCDVTKTVGDVKAASYHI